MAEDSRFAAKVRLVVGLAAAGCIVAFLFPAIPQDQEYHTFADQRQIWGVPNFWNTITNLPFIGVGLVGLAVAGGRKLAGGLPELRAGYLVFFAGVTLVGPGSAHYHLDPTNASLVWDRLPMTVAFTAFFSVVVGEWISVRAGRLLLWPLVFIGLASVVYWHVSEIAGSGDLRPYALVQFLLMALIPLILMLFRPAFSGSGWIWSVVGAYGASKVAELADGAIYALVDFASGHSLKHLLAAAGALFFARALGARATASGDAIDDSHISTTDPHTGDDR